MASLIPVLAKFSRAKLLWTKRWIKKKHKGDQLSDMSIFTYQEFRYPTWPLSKRGSVPLAVSLVFKLRCATKLLNIPYMWRGHHRAARDKPEHSASQSAVPLKGRTAVDLLRRHRRSSAPATTLVGSQWPLVTSVTVSDISVTDSELGDRRWWPQWPQVTSVTTADLSDR